MPSDAYNASDASSIRYIHLIHYIRTILLSLRWLRNTLHYSNITVIQPAVTHTACKVSVSGLFRSDFCLHSCCSTLVGVDIENALPSR